ncbi:hypothetical protein Scep_002488 [Stephania cephalantha]|uniref:EF-hand domain-containing protein n=1 Tax=Stephania cephalantha TaxID=152367 RepID=A0AAP0LBI5_9MAGN
MCPVLKSHDLRKIFDELDRDGNGFISVEELCSFFKKVGIVNATLNEVESIVGRPNLDLGDFVMFYESISMSNHGDHKGKSSDDQDHEDEKELVEAFKVFDMDDDGFISSDELQSVLSRLGMWEEVGGGDCRRMIREFDSNADGMLDFEEFKNMMLLTIP